MTSQQETVIIEEPQDFVAASRTKLVALLGKWGLPPWPDGEGGYLGEEVVCPGLASEIIADLDEIVLSLAEAPMVVKAMDKCIDGASIDGGHHKQFYLLEAAALLAGGEEIIEHIEAGGGMMKVTVETDTLPLERILAEDNIFLEDGNIEPTEEQQDSDEYATIERGS